MPRFQVFNQAVSARISVYEAFDEALEGVHAIPAPRADAAAEHLSTKGSAGAEEFHETETKEFEQASRERERGRGRVPVLSRSLCCPCSHSPLLDTCGRPFSS